jgi:hypothetical protein
VFQHRPFLAWQPALLLSSLSATHLIVPTYGNVPAKRNYLHFARAKLTMARRALLTDRERDLIEGKGPDDLRYQAVSRVRRKIEHELTTDVEILREHHPDLYAELREVVCEAGGSDERSES